MNPRITPIVAPNTVEEPCDSQRLESVPCLERVDFLQFLNEKVHASGNQKLLANEMGISPQYLSDLLKGRRQPSDKVLAHFGLKWEIVKDYAK